MKFCFQEMEEGLKTWLKEKKGREWVLTSFGFSRDDKREWFGLNGLVHSAIRSNDEENMFTNNLEFRQGEENFGEKDTNWY